MYMACVGLVLVMLTKDTSEISKGISEGCNKNEDH